MSIFSKLFGKKQSTEDGVRVGGVEDFMTLIRVYYQATLAVQLGISNMRFFPDMSTFKHTLNIPTQNNRVGVAERAKCKKLLTDLYSISENFYKEVDASVKKNCKTINDVNGFFVMFQGFSQDLLMVAGNLLQWKARIPSFFSKMLRSITDKAVTDILNKKDWDDEGVRKTCFGIRKYQKKLGYSEAWMQEYVYTIIKLAKKEPKPKS